jgi:hypothetical protein
MQFVAILYISGLRLTIQKKNDFLNSKSTVTTRAPHYHRGGLDPNKISEGGVESKGTEHEA